MTRFETWSRVPEGSWLEALGTQTAASGAQMCEGAGGTACAPVWGIMVLKAGSCTRRWYHNLGALGNHRYTCTLAYIHMMGSSHVVFFNPLYFRKGDKMGVWSHEREVWNSATYSCPWHRNNLYILILCSSEVWLIILLQIWKKEIMIKQPLLTITWNILASLKMSVCKYSPCIKKSISLGSVSTFLTL